ncbi:Mediator of RNA polymerase II transcription subunit 6 [Podospora pseudopauciseta]|uniref:Mediator of RNA polymerase II transcription subunit 6 n=2 Tax=Podospora TaxID=5144 RepID=A0A090CK60_PODAN|nr:Mediator of RNA polymerase II transcription subunit 6 [Podospora pseudopauciseta]CDP26209.1 Putative Mediator of RNA polymerase II transcription subunit 6 [Podospora anserina S mat+]
MATTSSRSDPLDEIRFTGPVEFEGGIHNNSVLYYFATSPFYDKTSNNEVLFQQGLNNPNMMQFLATREAFEGRLRTMSGLEFIVAQEPAETGPGAGTGVWVINKQTRRKRREGEEDEIAVHSVYYIVGEHIHMAPSFADIMSARLATISNFLSNILPSSASVQAWSPATGRVYNQPSTTTAGSNSVKAITASAQQQSQGSRQQSDIGLPTTRDFEKALYLHEQYGDQYMDENPITGRPGEFHLSSTGRAKVNLSAAAAAKPLPVKLPTINTKVADSPLTSKPTGKETKSPKIPGGPGKLKRRKSSKAAVTPS